LLKQVSSSNESSYLIYAQDQRLPQKQSQGNSPKTAQNLKTISSFTRAFVKRMPKVIHQS
jgi:hypothetical protein